MNSIKNIVVATDFSPGAQAALRQAVRIASKQHAQLHVIHTVRSEVGSKLLQIAPDMAPVMLQHLQDTGNEQLKAETQAAGAPATTKLYTVVGKPVAEILNLVQSTNADLLVIGATGSGGRRMGTVAGRCVRKGPTKILMVPPESTKPFSNIVVGIDLTEGCTEALAAAIRLASFDGGKVSAVHVYEVPWELARWGGLPQDTNKLEADLCALMHRQFKGFLPEQTHGVEVNFELMHGIDYGQGIVEYATKTHADLVVVGTTGRTQLGFWLLGTTAEKVMRDTACAVLALRI